MLRGRSDGSGAHDAIRTPDGPSDELLLALPKAQLHVHLDGSLRPSTMTELAEARGVDRPWYDPAVLADHMLASDAHGLEEYPALFVLTLAVMQDAVALERVAYELAEDHARESVRYVEMLDAVLAGLRRAERDLSLGARAIVCALRTLHPVVPVEMAALAVAYRHRRVVAFDTWPARRGATRWTSTWRRSGPSGRRYSRPPCMRAKASALPRSTRRSTWRPRAASAIGRASARTRGSRTRLREDPGLEAWVHAHGIPLETCLASNVRTRVARSHGEHPVRRCFALGIPIALSTDSRLKSRVTLTDEFRHARDHLGFSRSDLVGVARTGFEVAFVERWEREAMLVAFSAEVSGLAV